MMMGTRVNIEAAIELPFGAAYGELRAIAEAVHRDAALGPFVNPACIAFALGLFVTEEYELPPGVVAAYEPEHDCIMYLFERDRPTRFLFAHLALARAVLHKRGVQQTESNVARLAGLIGLPPVGYTEAQEQALQQHLPEWFIVAMQKYRQRMRLHSPKGDGSGVYQSISARLQNKVSL